MEQNLQNTLTDPVPPITPDKHVNLLPIVIVGAVMLLLGLGGGYLLFANKSNPKQSTTTVVQISPTSIPVAKSQPNVTSTSTQTNVNCGTEGTSNDASVQDPNNSSGVDNRPKEILASKKWENDAYLVTKLESFILKAGKGVTYSDDIYASSCTTDYLVYVSNPNELTQDGLQKKGYNATANIMNKDEFSHALGGPNLLQFPYNQELTTAQIAQWNAGQIPDFPWIINNTQYPSIGSQASLMPLSNNFIINGTTFSADSYVIQLNNSKKQGLFYDIIFTSATQESGTCPNNLCTFKVSALATASPNGNLLSFKTF